jgi:hypothetical protein
MQTHVMMKDTCTALVFFRVSSHNWQKYRGYLFVSAAPPSINDAFVDGSDDGFKREALAVMPIGR